MITKTRVSYRISKRILYGNNSSIKIDVHSSQIQILDHHSPEEYTPKLFTDEQNKENIETRELEEEQSTDQLFDHDKNEDEDFEIPAFLRRQKF